MDLWQLLIILIIVEAILPTYYLSMRYLSSKDNGIHKKYVEPLVSIIIPTYNEETTIISKISNIIELDYPKDKIELFLVDGNSTDNTVEIVQTIMRDHPELNISFIQEKERGGKIKAINATVPLCNGNFICISDSDCIWKENALKEAIANFSDESVGAVTGLQILMDNKELAEQLEGHYNSFYNYLRLGESVLDSTPIFRGELTIVRGSLFREIEVGTESAWADDSEIAMKIRKLGYRSIVDPKAQFYEFAPPTMNSRTTQKSRRGLGLVRLFMNNLGVIINPLKYGYYSLICISNVFYLLVSPVLVLIIPLLFGFVILGMSHFIMGFILLGAIVVVLVQYFFVDNKVFKFIYSFYHSQISLLISFQYLFSNNTTWSQITEVRDKWREREA